MGDIFSIDRYGCADEILKMKKIFPLSELYFKNDETALSIFPGWGQEGICPAAGAQATHFLESLTFCARRLPTRGRRRTL